MAKFKTINLAKKQEEGCCCSHNQHRLQAEKMQTRAMEAGNSNLDSNYNRNPMPMGSLNPPQTITALRRDNQQAIDGCGFETRLPVRRGGTGATKKTSILLSFYLLYFIFIFAAPSVNCDANKKEIIVEGKKAAANTESYVEIDESMSASLKAPLKSLSHGSNSSQINSVPTRITDSFDGNTNYPRALPGRSQNARDNSDSKENADLSVSMDSSGSQQNTGTQSYKDRLVTDDHFGGRIENDLFGKSSLNSRSRGFDSGYTNPYSLAPRSLFSSNSKFPEMAVNVITDPPRASGKFSSRFKFPKEESQTVVDLHPRIKSLAEAINAIKLQAQKNNSGHHSYYKEGQANDGMDFKDYLSNHRAEGSVAKIANDTEESTSQASFSASSHLYPVYVSYQQNHGDSHVIGTNPQSKLHQGNRFYQRVNHHDQHLLSGKLREFTSKGRPGDITDFQTATQGKFDSPHFMQLPKDASQHDLRLKNEVFKEEGKYFEEVRTESEGHTVNVRKSPNSILQSPSQMSRPASLGSRTPSYLDPRTPFRTSTKNRTPSIPRGYHRHARERDLAPQGSSTVDQVSRSYGMLFMPVINLRSLEGLSIITLATYMVRVFVRLLQIRMSGRRRKRSIGSTVSGWSGYNGRTDIGGSGRIDDIVEGFGNGTANAGSLIWNSTDDNGTHDISSVDENQLWWKGDNEWQEELTTAVVRAVEKGAGWLMEKDKEWRKRELKGAGWLMEKDKEWRKREF